MSTSAPPQETAAAPRIPCRPGKKPRLVVLGTGFAALSMLDKLHKEAFDITVVSPRNHFLFTPLLPSTTVGSIEFRSIIEPIRSAVRFKNFTFFQAFVTAIDTSGKRLSCEGAMDGARFTIDYDVLVVAVGAVSRTFNIPGVREHAHFLKELNHARAIRQRIIECFERAAHPGLHEEEDRRLLHFVVVGGGPTGVEFAAELHDFLTQDLRKWYPREAAITRITVVEASSNILNAFHEELGSYAMKRFHRNRIDVRTGAVVKEVTPTSLKLTDGSEIPCGLVVWSTGIEATPLVQSLPFPKDKGQRLHADPYFCVDESAAIYAIGDCATRIGDELPATAQVAMQEGRYLAYVLNRKVEGKPPKVFKYKHLGMMAYIGNRRALADLPNWKGRGFSAWVFWRSVYLTKLVSLKNKMTVAFDWFKALLFGRDVSSF
ncbi:MAG: FAD-dependent oxidoreductase [Kiritimatiellia bacterium]